MPTAAFCSCAEGHSTKHCRVCSANAARFHACVIWLLLAGASISLTGLGLGGGDGGGEGGRGGGGEGGEEGAGRGEVEEGVREEGSAKQQAGTWCHAGCASTLD